MSGDNSALRKRKSTTSPSKMGLVLTKVSKLLEWGEKTEEEAVPSSSKTVQEIAVENDASRIAAGADGDDTSKVAHGVEATESKDDEGPPTLDRQDDQPTEQLLPLDTTQECSPPPSPVKAEKKKKEDDAEEAKEAKNDQKEEDIKVDKVVEKTPLPLRSSSRGKKTIADFGYHFKDGKLRTIEGDEGFKFTTQREYEQLGDLIGDYVYELLEQEGLTKRYFEVGRNRRFYFASHNYERKDRILVLIHGSGVVKAGQWARRLIINESIERGTQLPYIKKGLANGWGVVVINYNETCVGQTKGCHGPDSHGTNEMKFALQPVGDDAEVVVVAHSAGGGVISSAVKDMHRKDDYRVLCVALTDSWFSEGKEVFAVNFNTTKKELSRRAGVFQMFSGDETHEGSSSACINACFALLEGVTFDTTNEEFLELLEESEHIISTEYKEKQRAKRRQEAGDTASVKSLELEKARADEAVGKKEKKKEGEEKDGEKKEEEEGKEKVKEEVKKEKDGKKEEDEEKKEQKDDETDKDQKKAASADADGDGDEGVAKDASPGHSDTEN